MGETILSILSAFRTFVEYTLRGIGYVINAAAIIMTGSAVAFLWCAIQHFMDSLGPEAASSASYQAASKLAFYGGTVMMVTVVGIIVVCIWYVIDTVVLMTYAELTGFLQLGILISLCMLGKAVIDETMDVVMNSEVCLFYIEEIQKATAPFLPWIR